MILCIITLLYRLISKYFFFIVMGVFIYLYYKVAWVLVIFKCLNVCHFVENTHYQYSVSANKGFLQSGGNK